MTESHTVRDYCLLLRRCRSPRHQTLVSRPQQASGHFAKQKYASAGSRFPGPALNGLCCGACVGRLPQTTSVSWSQPLSHALTSCSGRQAGRGRVAWRSPFRAPSPMRRQLWKCGLDFPKSSRRCAASLIQLARASRLVSRLDRNHRSPAPHRLAADQDHRTTAAALGKGSGKAERPRS